MVFRHMALLLTFATAWPLCGQTRQGPHRPLPHPQTTGPQSRSQAATFSPSTAQIQTPLYVNGRVILETGRAALEPVSVGLNCGETSLQLIHTDLDGYFRFVLGAGIQSNMDFSASEGAPSGLAGLGSGPRGLFGCEVRLFVPGYAPVTKTITEPPDIQGIDVGILLLRPLEGVRGFSVSETSLLVPSGARKEFDKAESDFRNNRLPSAVQHLEKAVAQDDKYAAAWNQLARIYVVNHETEKANLAYRKAIAGDPRYIPPYIGLANLELQMEQYESAIEYAQKALALDAHTADARFIEAAAEFHLNRLDAAAKNAQEVEKDTHQNIPQVHLLLADIFMKKHDPSNAAVQMRAYLKESPRGPSAEDVKRNLALVEKLTADDTAKLSEPQTGSISR
jgi:tetratricopeptide (TPR) repeat protein